MNRRTFLCGLMLGMLSVPLAVEGQQAGRVYRIGFLGTDPPPPPVWNALLDGLREHGYSEGRNLLFERRFSEGYAERFPDLAAELVRLRVDVIIVPTTPAALAARNATRTIPIIITTAIDPVGAGLVASLARPGGNITGLSDVSAELGGKRLQLLKEVIPGATRVAVLWNAANPGNVAAWKETQAAAHTLGLMLLSHEVRGPQDFNGAFALMAREHPDALLVLVDALLNMHSRQIVEFVSQQRIASMFAGTAGQVLAGGLMSYGPSIPDLFRRAATFVDKILKGAKPADLPVEQPTKFVLVINLKTAKALGLTIPQTLLLRADQVIE
jgi:putative tryptophan/tyrosine transport system substrate-binding protein